jgi:hypothetical protein
VTATGLAAAHGRAHRDTDPTKERHVLTIDRNDTSRDRRDLAALVETAARIPLDDATAVGRLRCDARTLTARLAAIGTLPAHLVVGDDDPAVVVVRTLVAARARSGAAVV